MDTILNYIGIGAQSLPPFIILLGVLIFVHELGHFLVARWCGVRVEVFSLGFGKKILQYHRGDTNYCISIIPLGGYVKMFGDQPDADVPDELKKYSFTHKNVWKRIAIVLAGPLMNFFFAIIIFALIAMLGEDIKAPRLGDIQENSVAAQSGLSSGDLVLSIADQTISTGEELQKALNRYQNQNVQIKIQPENDPGSSQQNLIKDVMMTVGSKENTNLFSWSNTQGDLPGVSQYSRGTSIGVLPNSPLGAFGVKTGDQIIALGRGESALIKMTYWRDLERFLMRTSIDQPLTLEFQRSENKKQETFKVTLSGKSLIKVYSTESLGIESSELYLDRVLEGSPAEQAGLKSRDRILSINEVRVSNWDEVLNKIKSFNGESNLNFEVMRGNERLKFEVTPKMGKATGSMGQEEQRFTVGIAPLINFAPVEFSQLKIVNPFIALWRGTTKTIDFSIMTLMSFVRLVQNKISPKNIGGIISIGQAASETFKLGWAAFLQMMALISVNLFVLNLLPIPILDGGHMVFYTIEVIRGAPLSLRKMEIAQQVGMVLLMSLMVFALFNDITRFFKL